MDQVELIEQLESLPILLEEIGQKAEELREEWKLKETLHTYLENKKSLLLKVKEKTATEVKWEVGSETEVYTSRVDCVRKEANYRKKLSEYDCLQEKINSLKVIAKLQMIGG